MDILQSALGVLQTLAVIAASIAAIIGVSTWRKQMVGRRKMELAEEILTLVYEVQGAMEWVRNPAGWSSEGQSRPGRADEPDEGLQRLKDAYYVPAERLSHLDEEFARLRVLRHKAKAYFGHDLEEALAVFHRVRNDVSTAVHMLLATASDDQVEGGLRKEWDRKARNMGTTDHPDEIVAHLEAAVSTIEEHCRPLLTGK